MDQENRELNLNDMEKVTGGGTLQDKEGFWKYKIRRGDNLSKIAKEQRVTIDLLLKWNPQIVDPDFIKTGDELYIRE